MPRIDVDGLSIRYRHHAATRPDAPSLLLLHMAGSSSVAWSATANRIGDSVEVLIPDLPGHGQSAGEPLTSIAAMAHFAQRFLDAHGLRRVHVGGHSMGGAVALQLTLSAPARVRSLLLVSTSARLSVAPVVFELIDKKFDQMPALFAGQAAGTSPVSQALPGVEPIFPQTSQEGVRRDFAACAQSDLRDRLGEITCPAAVVVGRDDQLTPPRWSEHLAAGIAGASLHIEQGSGHLLPREKPALVAGIARELLQRASP
ncbi:MAG: alpha/beta fold hydrolase [Pseudomonadota bacterium]